jgi:hypothetical protein
MIPTGCEMVIHKSRADPLGRCWDWHGPCRWISVSASRRTETDPFVAIMALDPGEVDVVVTAAGRLLNGLASGKGRGVFFFTEPPQPSRPIPVVQGAHTSRLW